MAPIANGRLIFNEVPTGYPEPGKTTIYDASSTIDLESVPLEGGVLIKTLVLSVDPYLRGKMRDSSIESYTPAFIVGEPLENFGVGVVLRSEHASIKPGEHVYGIFPFQQYFVEKNASTLLVLKNEEKLPWSVYVGVCGMPGQTAYYAWKEYASPEKGDVVFVTAGAGPVGATVIQLAKGDGLKVIASAGSEEKVAFMSSLGTDVVFNYKTTDTAKVLEKEGPINIYWDNVGGETLQAAIEAAAPRARFIECGMIATYNNAKFPIKDPMAIVTKELKLLGFIVTSLHEKYAAEFYKEMPKRVANGDIRYTEDLKYGLEYAGHAIEEVQRGRNKGKSAIVVAKE